jgi:predicted ester cyclase
MIWSRRTSTDEQRQPSTLPEAVMVSPETFGALVQLLGELMSIDGNKDLVRRFLDECVLGGQTDVLDEICSPDVVNHAAAPGLQHGIAGAKEVIGFSRRAQPDQCWTEQHVIAEGDLVVVYGVREGTWQGRSFRDVYTPSGRRVSVELAHMFRIENGKIAEHWAVRDDFGMFQQLGVAPAPRAPQAT